MVKSDCKAGSIEQQLDMCEKGPLRGDSIEREKQPRPGYKMDLSETGREGAEESGDEHSMGLQGGEPELESQPRIATGIPGDLSRRINETAMERIRKGKG